MEVISVEPWPRKERTDFRPLLEAGNILYFPQSPFQLDPAAQEFLRGLEFGGGSLHKNIAYRPASDRVTGIGPDGERSTRLVEIMRGYSQQVTRFTAELLPEYAKLWKLDYASFRPLEEQGRDLPINKRNDLIHTDAFPTRPTNGALILRVFSNIHPTKTRNWVVTDPFAQLAEQYAPKAGLNRIATAGDSTAGRLAFSSARLLHGLGFPIVPRSPYDRFMLHFHEYLKRNADFQEHCPKFNFNFPPGSTWLTFTDLVPHSVHSGQHALEQTFIVAKSSLENEERSPARILEKLCGRRLLSNA